MASNSKNKKKKSKSRNNTINKKSNSNSIPKNISVEVVDESKDYPTSRVIKRAPNGDVVVEPITPAVPSETSSKKKKSSKKNVSRNVSNMANVLDLHWESLLPEEKKEILRIDKNDVFQIMQKYQSDYNCNCSVCGKRHLVMDQEMERIYDMLYEIDKIKDPEITPIKFHLSIIKDLQISKNHNNSNDNKNKNVTHGNSDLFASPQTVPIISQSSVNINKDGNLKEILTSNNANFLKEETLNSKQAKQLENKEYEKKNNTTSNNTHEELSRQLPSPLPEDKLQRIHVEQQHNNPESSYIEDKLLEGRYLQFTHKYISSHTKIAEEYVKRVMMYPEMRQVTDRLMASDGDGFLKAIENFVIERARDEDGNIDEGYYQKLGDVRSFTTVLHKGQPLTPQEYADLQRNIAERMTSSYDTKRREFRDISPLEKELFARFMFGEDREQFGEMVMQSFREKFDHEFGGASISASLAAAAAAATLTNPLNVSNDNSSMQREKEGYEESYDYSDYEEDEDESDFFSEYTDDDDNGLSNYGDETDSDNECFDQSHHHHTNDQVFVQHGVNIDTDDQEHYYHDDDDENHHISHDEDYESEVDETARLEEGRKLIQIAITKLLQSRILESYHAKQADVNRLKLLQELEDEEEKKRAKEEKKQRKKAKEKEKRKLQQQAKEEERRKKLEEEERLRKESEQREKERREAQRRKVEEAKRKKDEERRRRLEEQRKREEQQEKQRKLKEEMKKKKEEERKRREKEQKEKEEEEARKRKEQKEKEERLIKETKEREKRLFHEKVVGIQTNGDPDIEKENNVDKHEFVMVNSDKIVNTSSNSSNDIDNSYLPHKNNLANREGGNIDNLISNNDILPVTDKSLLGNFTSFNNITSLTSNDSVHYQPNVSLSSQPISSSTASGLLSSSLWNNIADPRPSTSMFNTIADQNTSFLSLSNNEGFNSITQDMGIHGSHYQQPQQHQQLVQNDGISKSLDDELNNLTSLLQSTDINDALYPRSSVLGSTSLWTDSKLATNNSRVSMTNSNPTASLLSSNKLLGHIIPVANPMVHNNHSLHHRKSIWDDDLPPTNSVSVSTTTNFPLLLNGSSIPLLPKMDNNNLTSNSTCWDNTNFSNTSQMNSNSIGLATTTTTNIPHADINEILHQTHQTRHTVQPNSLNGSNGTSLLMNSNSNSLNDHVIFDLICKAYCAVIQKQPTNHNFVPVDTLYHEVNSIMPIDYHTFVNKILEMHILHGCEILNSSMGAISHIKIYLDTISHGGISSTLEQRKGIQENGQSQMNSSIHLNVVGSNGP